MVIEIPLVIELDVVIVIELHVALIFNITDFIEG